MPSATPTVPTTNIFSKTVGSANQPGKFTILNGKLVFSDGSSASSYKLLFDGENVRILINDGTNDRILIGKYTGLF